VQFKSTFRTSKAVSRLGLQTVSSSTQWVPHGEGTRSNRSEY